MLGELLLRQLGGALSRYNGMTNSVKLDALYDVITGELFGTRPYCYAHEVIKEFEDKHVGGNRSAQVYLLHSILFGFLHVPTIGPESPRQGVPRKINKYSHIALTSLGRACRATQNWEDGYAKFIWEYAVLECDFDLYGLFLSMSLENDGKSVGWNDLYSSFNELCEKKLVWLKKTIPSQERRDSIRHHIDWMKENKGKLPIGEKVLVKKLTQNRTEEKVIQFNEKTAKHHFFQRRKWARILGHMDGDCITSEGRRFVACLPARNDAPFFWLAPSEECVKARIISRGDIPKGYSYSPAWNLLRPKTEKTSCEEVLDSFVDGVADYMTNSFGDIRMKQFNQAPFSAVTPYVYFLEREFGKRVDEYALFNAVLKKHNKRLSFLLHRDISRASYRIKSA